MKTLVETALVMLEAGQNVDEIESKLCKIIPHCFDDSQTYSQVRSAISNTLTLFAFIETQRSICAFLRGLGMVASKRDGMRLLNEFHDQEGRRKDVESKSVQSDEEVMYAPVASDRVLVNMYSQRSNQWRQIL